jgi:hypothetical protein
MKPDWRKPTREEAAQGYIAMLKESYFCQLEHGLHEVDYSGGYFDKQANRAVPKVTRWTGYTPERLQRRMSWGGDMPPFIEIGQSQEIAA